MPGSGQPILELVDFIDEMMSGTARGKANMMVTMTYVVFIASAAYIWHHHSDKDFSFILTVAGALQTLGFFMLLHKIRVTRSVAGLSSKTLQVYVMVFCCRLTSTMVKNGYLPVDSTGDWVYQATDIASLLLVFQLLFFIHKRHKCTYQSELDTMPIFNVLPCVVLFACCFHGTLNHSPFFDKMWSIGMWMDTVAMLPQLWMLVAKGGEVEGLTSNFVALIFLSRCLAFAFWYTGYPELAPANGGFNMVGFVIMAAHSLQLLFSADFMYHYLMWQRSNCHDGHWGCGIVAGKGKGMILPSGGNLDI